MSVMLKYMNLLFMQYGINIDYILMVMTVVLRNANEAMMTPMVGVWKIMSLMGVWS
jgi:hypothetical protein